ncbi:MAG TPA: hypothetical protein VHG90_14205 [Acidimicrobiales bacterium]|nr:hypothetical protein [Acidimicrobiales bacterium]
MGVALLAAALVPSLSTPSGAVLFCNATPITFTPPTTPTQSVQPFTPYPSNITVSGLAGTITDVNVTLNGFTHVRPEDIDVLLVAPDGTNHVLMSDIGGDNLFPGEPVSGVNLTFDDQAAAPAPADSQLSSGTFRPTDDDNDVDEFVTGNADTFTSPAPAPSANQTLGAFNGRQPNGTWSLFVVDDQPGPPEPASFSGGWCVDINTTGTGTTAPTTTAPTTTTTAPTTTTTAPTTTTTAPTTTTTAPTTTTSAPTTTTTAPTTTTTAPTTTTTSTTTTSTVPPTTTSSTSTTSTVAPTTTSSPGTTVPQTTTTTRAPGGTCGGLTPTIVGTAGRESIFGTPGPDVILGGGGNDVILGRDGNDVICGGDGADTVIGGDGDDRLLGDAGNDRLLGGPGSDSLNGGVGVDVCVGDRGTDTASACETTVTVP